MSHLDSRPARQVEQAKIDDWRYHFCVCARGQERHRWAKGGQIALPALLEALPGCGKCNNGVVGTDYDRGDGVRQTIWQTDGLIWETWGAAK